MFSDKSKAADAEWKIEIFKQDKKHIVDFMIEFKALAMKADTNNLHTIFLLKKNVQADIIKTILEYPPMAAPDTLKKWKVAITVVGQGYKSIESQHDYKTNTRITFGGRGAPIDIESPETTLTRTENQDISTAIYTDIWPKNVEGTRKKERRESATNVTNKDT